MRGVRRFSLAEVDSGRGTSRLLLDGRVLDFTVEGLLLEAQLELEDGSCLVWLTQLQVEPRARFGGGLPLGWAYHRWLARHCLSVNKLRP